jgi:hypothetical protein
MGRKFFTNDVKKFNRFLTSWQEIEVKGNYKENVMALARGYYKRFIQESPVLIGNFRINTRWDLNRDEAITIEAPATPPERYSYPNAEEWNNSNYYIVKSQFKIGDSIYISNHVPYVYKVEFDGWAETSAYRPFQRAFSYTISNPDKTMSIGKTVQ